jgi:hypothetical protein
MRLKYGWIIEFDNQWAECLLRKDHELDEELTLERCYLTDQQNKMIEIGQVVMYDKKSKKVQFKKGSDWC